MATAPRFAPQPRDREQSNRLTLDKLLDENQPYNRITLLKDPELEIDDDDKLRRIQGSLIGVAVGDALGASVEFRPNAYLKQHPVNDMQSGGTWGLQAGQWTDDTSMALCLAASLIVKGKSEPYDQFERYRRWYRYGYMSSTGKCFDIGKSTRQAITEFEDLQNQVKDKLVKQHKLSEGSIPHEMIRDNFHTLGGELKRGRVDSAGNGALMRLAPIPCFFQTYADVEKVVDEATRLTHGDQRAVDACQFYAFLIWHALNGKSKNELLDPNFYRNHMNISLHEDIKQIAEGLYQNKKGYDDGIRGKGYAVNALEAALWAFYNDDGSFKKGVLLAVNLGDDTDTTAAIYGALAGAVYGIQGIPKRWIEQLYQEKFIMTVAKGLYVKGKQFNNRRQKSDRSDKNDQRHHRTTADTRTDHDEKTNETSRTHSGQHTGVNSTLNSNKTETDDTLQNRSPAVISEQFS